MSEEAPSRTVMLDGELMFPSDYVKAEELKGRDVHLTIAKVFRDDAWMVRGGKKLKKKSTVLMFHGTEKKLGLNKTNAATIASMHGYEARQWVGKRITLYPTETEFNKKMVPCIRIRPTPPPAKKADGAPPANPEETQ